MPALHRGSYKIFYYSTAAGAALQTAILVSNVMSIDLHPALTFTIAWCIPSPPQKEKKTEDKFERL